MKFLRIITSIGGKEIESRINSKYIVSMNELLNGSTEILLESGERYVTNKSIFKIEQEIAEIGERSNDVKDNN